MVSTVTNVQEEILSGLNNVLGWLPESECDDDNPVGRTVPRRLVERDSPGLAGTDYWTLLNMAEEMQSLDPKMNYDSLLIIGDEVWNFTNGQRTVNDIAFAIGAEFGFDLEPKHVLTLFRGLEQQGYVALDS